MDRAIKGERGWGYLGNQRSERGRGVGFVVNKTASGIGPWQRRNWVRRAKDTTFKRLKRKYAGAMKRGCFIVFETWGGKCMSLVLSPL